MNPLSERLLLAKVKNQSDPEAFAKIYDAYIKQLYRFVYFKVGSHEEAEDITADVFLKAWNYLQDRSREVESVSGLLYRIARTTIIDWYRTASRRPKTVSTDVIDDEDGISFELSDESRGIQKTEQTMDFKLLLKALDKLKHDYRELVVLRYIDELSIKEIAEVTGKTSLTIRVTLHRALKKLEDFLKPPPVE
jgi:RNA polymerase sigma-70 factor (ECF subfamily)